MMLARRAEYLGASLPEFRAAREHQILFTDFFSDSRDGLRRKAGTTRSLTVSLRLT